MFRRSRLLPLLSAALLASIPLGTDVMAGPIAPDGRIVFASDADGDWDIWTMNADGSDPRNLTSEGEPPGGWQDASPTWSPDGTRIAFTSTRGGGQDSDVFVMSAEGADITPVTSDEQPDFGPDWSPDGSRLVFTRHPFDGSADSDIFVIDSDGTNEHNISAAFEAQEGQFQWSDKDPDWSPVANSIVFASARQVEGSPEGAYWRIVTADPDGSDQTLVSNPNDPGNDPFPDDIPNFDEFPEWSPDGQWITFATHQQPEQQWDVQIVRADGTDQQNILPDEFYEDTRPTWSPSGTEILFTSNRTGDHTRAIYSVDVSGAVGAASSTTRSIRTIGGPTEVGGVGVSVDPDQWGRLPCTIRGTSIGDQLRGTAGRDVICAGSGDDSVEAARGRDVVYAGPGVDVILGKRGGDILFGGGGFDTVRGGAGVDLCPDHAATDRTSCQG